MLDSQRINDQIFEAADLIPKFPRLLVVFTWEIIRAQSAFEYLGPERMMSL